MQAEIESMLNNLGQDATLIQKRDTGSGTVTDPVVTTARIPVVVVDQGTKSIAKEEAGGVIIRKDYRSFLMSTTGVKSTIAAVTSLVRGAWGAPEVLTEQIIASGDRNDFEPIGESGVQATNIGMFVWYTESNNRTILFASNDRPLTVAIKREHDNDFISNIPTTYFNGNSKNFNANANRERDPLPTPQFQRISYLSSFNVAKNNPPITISDYRDRFGILLDDATSQSLYYCNDQINRCEHYRRSITTQVLEPERVEYKTPKQSDVLEFSDGTQLTIKEAERTSPGGVDLLYNLYLE